MVLNSYNSDITLPLVSLGFLSRIQHFIPFPHPSLRDDKHLLVANVCNNKLVSQVEGSD